VSKPIGQKPEDQEDVRKLFLRQSSVLLKPGEAEAEVDFTYKRKLDEVFGLMRYTVREFLIPLSLRCGLFERAEAFVSVPLEYAQKEVNYLGEVDRRDHTGIGDTSAGLKYLLFRETNRRPDIIVSLGFIAPSGPGPYKDANDVPIGSGHWAITPGIQFVKTYDPVVLFGGIDYTHQFARHGFGQEVQPGETISYNFGMGFAINQDVSVSTQLLGSFQSETRLHGKNVPGSSREPVAVRLALTNRWNKDLYVEPSVTFGIDTDHPDFALGIGLVYRFGGK